VSEKKLSDTKPLEKNPSMSLKALLDHVAANGTHGDYLSSLASRLSRMDKQCGPDDRSAIRAVSGGVSLATIAAGLLHAIDGDAHEVAARNMFALSPDVDPTDEQLKKAAEPIKRSAILPLMSQPRLRTLILELRQKFEQMVDEVSRDELLSDGTGLSEEARRRAGELARSFESYIAEHKDEIDALQFFYSVPHKRRLRYTDIKALAEAISAPPRSWTPEKLWHAYEVLEKSKVRGASAGRLLVDVVSLVKFALHQDGQLVPHVDRVREQFGAWLAAQENRGRAFTPDQRRWLDMMRDHIATSLEIEMDDFDLTPFTNEGGLAGATKVFGSELGRVVRELNEALAA
jgi:type I restriction enzyme R subunit